MPVSVRLGRPGFTRVMLRPTIYRLPLACPHDTQAADCGQCRGRITTSATLMVRTTDTGRMSLVLRMTTAPRGMEAFD